MKFTRSILLVLTAAALAAGCSGGAKDNPNVPRAGETVTEPDKVIAFVEEAIAYTEEHGKEAAFAAFSDPNGGFVRGELYIFAYDFEGFVFAHGGKPEVVGTNILDTIGPDGQEPVRLMLEAAADGTGWRKFVWPNPDRGNANEVKWGYSQKVDDTWWIGSGTYAKNP